MLGLGRAWDVARPRPIPSKNATRGSPMGVGPSAREGSVGILKRLINWVRRRGRPHFHTITGPDGQPWHVDDVTMQYLKSTAPQPTQASLDALLDDVHAVRVFRDGCHDDTLLSSDLLLQVDDPTDVAALREALSIVDGPGGHCLCFGDPTLEMLSQTGSRLALVSLHHGLSIRWNQWKDDATLVDGRTLLDWLAERGVVEPLREFEAAEARKIQGKKDWDRWLAAMPSPLTAVWSDAIGEYGSVDVSPLRDALERGLPGDGERILALFEWFGSGAGPWSGFPSYEKSAEDLLLDYSTARLVEVAESTPLSDAQLEGAARLFAGWAFNKQRPDGLRELPDGLRQALWEHVKDTEDDDKRARATRALAG
jgi:hypothetical protein